MPDSPALTLVCLGTPTARLAGRDAPSEVLWRKNLALLIYLALSPNRTRTREHLVGILWPETTERLARKSLTEAVRRLRKLLGASRLVSHADAITLSDGGLEVDAIALDAGSIDTRGAATLVGGDFLEGFSLPDAPEFDQWASNERAGYRAKSALLLVEAGERSLVDLRLAAAQELARRALTLEPLSEPGTRLLLRAAALAGDAASALRAYHEYSARLEQEVGEQPSRDLARLAERIRAQRWQRVSAKHADAEPPLIGRSDVHRAAFATLSRGLKDGPRIVVISSDAGLGKTRLLAECADRLTLDGATVAAARVLESDHDAPWSTLRALMRAGLLSAPGIAATKPGALSVLAAVVPEFAERTAPRPPQDHAEVADALASLLEASAQEGPIGLAIDDAHFADDATIDALHRAIVAVRSVPLALVITSKRVGDDLPLALLRLHSDIGRGVQGIAVDLKPLSADDLRALTETLAPWCRTEGDRDRLARRITVETGGSPFLAVTLLRGLDRVAPLRPDALAWPPPEATFDAPLPLSVPSLARAAIIARVAQLEPDVRRVAATASVLGIALDIPLITQLVDRPREWVNEKLSGLEHANLLTFDGERYAFAAALIAQVVRGEFLTPGQRPTLRRQAVAALAARTDLEARVLRAELLAEIAPSQESFREAADAARLAMAEGAPRTARRALVVAERAIGALADEERAELALLQSQFAILSADRGGDV
jgi:DNA-binding SARP family transcriptional activator